MRKLSTPQKLSEKEWLKGFVFGSDGLFYVVVDTVFYSQHYQKWLEDDFYYTKEQFRKKFLTKKIGKIMVNTFIPPTEVINRFGYLIKEKGKLSGLEFAKAILNCGKDCKSFRENNASTAASAIYEVEVYKDGGFRSVEFIK